MINIASQSLPTLFLDFDGVLHPNHSHPGQMFSRTPLLVDAIQSWKLDIVISSSWRFGHRLPGLRALLPEAIRDRVVGATGPAHIGCHARWHEISTYCASKDITNWRALDDAAFEFPDPCSELIHCEGGIGIGEAQVAALKHWLGSSCHRGSH